MTHYEAVKLVRLAAGTSECPDLADFLCYLEDILKGDWEIVEQLGETEYYEVERDERGTEQSRRRITDAELAEAERQLELEAEAKYGDPEATAAERVLEDDLYDREREMP